jgi:lipoprotein signal peptidase
MAETHRRLGYGLAAALFLADQITKAIIIGPVALQQAGQIYLLPILNLTWVENYGIARGMMPSAGCWWPPQRPLPLLWAFGFAKKRTDLMWPG